MGLKVFALEVLDQRQLEDFPVARLSDYRRGLGDPKLARGPPPALASNELILVIDPSNDQRLDDAAFANAVDQFLQVLAAKFLPRLERARRNLVQGESLDALT